MEELDRRLAPDSIIDLVAYLLEDIYEIDSGSRAGVDWDGP